MADRFAEPLDLAAFLHEDADTFLAEDDATGAATQALEAATARIQAVTRGWRFLPVAAVTASLRGGGAVLRLQRPVTVVTAVSSTSLGLTTAHAVNVDYEVSGHELRWLGTYVWPTNLTVTYSRGMAAIPADVKDACLQLAALRFTNPLGEGGERIDDYTAPDRPTGPDDPQRRILDDIRRAYPSAGLSVPLVRA